MDPSTNATAASLQALGDVYGLLLDTVTGTYVSNVLAETVLFGVHSMLVTVSLNVLIGKGWRHKPRLFMIIACVVLYSMSLWHWAATVHSIFALGSLLSGMISGGMDCTNTLLSASSCPPSLEQMILDFDKASRVCVISVPLLTSIILGDAVVLWRALVLWPRNRIIQVISAVLLLSSLGASAVSLSETCNSQLMDWYVGVAKFEDVPGAVAFTFSWATNMWATSLIAYKAWTHRRTLLQSNVLTVDWPKKTSRALLIFVETGILYTILWTCITIPWLSMARESAAHETPRAGMIAFYIGITNLKESALVNVIGIYPTALILAVTLSDSYAERALQDSRNWAPQLPSASLAQSTPRLPATRAITGDENVPLSERNSISQSVIILSLPSPLASSHEDKFVGDNRYKHKGSDVSSV